MERARLSNAENFSDSSKQEFGDMRTGGWHQERLHAVHCRYDPRCAAAVQRAVLPSVLLRENDRDALSLFDNVKDDFVRRDAITDFILKRAKRGVWPAHD